MLQLTINGREHRVDAAPDAPLLWILRDHLDMPGTKFGCGVALCGACTVHIDGQPARACVIRAADAAGKAITTIEGLDGKVAQAVQQAWEALDVPQCGYCQSGQIMAVAALLTKSPKPTDADIDTAITNICRCGTYPRMRAAIHRAAGEA